MVLVITGTFEGTPFSSIYGQWTIWSLSSYILMKPMLFASANTLIKRYTPKCSWIYLSINQKFLEMLVRQMKFLNVERCGKNENKSEVETNTLEPHYTAAHYITITLDNACTIMWLYKFHSINSNPWWMHLKFVRYFEIGLFFVPVQLY